VEIMQVGHEQRSSRVAGCRHESAEFSGQSTGMKQDFPHRGTAIGAVAVFVDGENLSHARAGAIVTEAERLGARGIRRVYGAATAVAGWRQQGTFRIVDCGPGKNGADIMLALEAVLLEGVRHVVIASSDGDFTPLALRLAERGVQVTGIGEAKAPEGFRKACAKFVELVQTTAAEPVVATTAPDVPVADARTALCKVRKELKTFGPATNGMPMKAFGQAMSQRQKVRVRDMGSKTWRAFLGRYPKDFEFVNHKGEARVRLRAEG
jgi:hypothetical protein